MIPEDIARKSDIDDAVTRIVENYKTGENHSTGPVSVTVSQMDVLEKVELDKKTRKAVKAEIGHTENMVDDNNTILKRMEARQNRSDNETTLRNKLLAFKIIVAVFIAVFSAFGVAFFYKDNKIEHLTSGVALSLESHRKG